MYRDPRTGRFIARDGLANMMSGAGTTVDRRTASFYALRYTDPQQIEAAYRTSWLMRKIIDVPAYDETREWRIWQAKETEIEGLDAAEKKFQLRQKVRRARTLARLHGGGAIMLGVGREDPAMELDPAKVRKGDLRYAHVFSRHELTLGEKRRFPDDPWFGEPEYYEINDLGRMQVRVHPSRIIPFIGQAVPENSQISSACWFWGDPLMQSIEDAVKNADAAQNGFASLIDEARTDIIKMPDLMTNAASAEYERSFMRRLELAAMGKSTHRALVIDALEEWDQRQVTWTGMPEIIQSYLQLVSGAADIPVTRLLGQSPAGMNATGASDLRNYYDSVSSKQENDLRPLLDRIDDILLPSVFGKRPDDIWYDFAPLWQMTPEEKSKVDKAYAEIAESDARSGLLPMEALAAGRRGRVIEDGIYPGIDAALAKAEAAGNLDPEPEGDDDPSAIVPVPGQEPQRRAANDAAPRSLYVSRKVENVAEIKAWAKAQGLPELQDDLHVTIAYSKQPVDWIKAGNGMEWGEADGKMTIAAGGPRVIEPLGGMTAVLMFASSTLYWRHEDIKRAGASWDWPDYQPHISLTKEPVDLAGVEPYRGKIVLGAEIFEEIREDV